MKATADNVQCLLVVCCVLFCCVAASLAANAVPVAISEDGVLLLKTDASHRGLSVVNTASGEEMLVATSLGAGRYASLSPNERYVCFKQIETDRNGARTQMPMLFDLASGKLIPLAPASTLAGTPAISGDGKIAFTVGNTLTVLDAELNPVASLELGHHVNLLGISPDGSRIAYNDQDEQIVVVALGSLAGKPQVVTDGNGSYWNPQFSPSGDKLLVSSVDGRVLCLDLASGETTLLGKGSNPAWVNDDTIAFTQKTSNGRVVTRTELCLADCAGKKKQTLLINDGDAEVVTAGNALAVGKDGTLQSGSLEESLTLNSVPAGNGSALATSIGSGAKSEPLQLQANTVLISGVPTVHQVYDTPEWFNGHWACGATAASMALAYYGCLRDWNCWCMEPYSHYSPYGNYIADTYIYNSFTFDIVETDPNGEYATGGYGYITQNDWEDTKTHMAEYISYHGPSSYVDWSPTFAKACTETDNSNPYVLLNLLTSAGHYITGIGYYTDQYTLIFNDPYGNKNTTGYPSYDGTEVSYDWPGYNYGNENLNTVYCYIYARYTVQPTPGPSPTPIAEVIVDNADPECNLSGDWTLSTSVRGWYDSNYAVASTKSGALATFNLTIPQAGDYDVYAYWTAASDRSRQAPYTVYYEGGTDTQTFDQCYWGGRFRLIGTYPFQAGAYKVELSASTGEGGKTRYVIADAVKAVIPVATPTPTPSPTPSPTPTPGTDVIVDNDYGEPWYSETGTWTTSVSSGYNGGTYRYSWGGEIATATWTGSLAETGNYECYTMFRQSTNRVTAAEFVIHASDGDHTVYIDQSGENVMVERYLGTFPFNAGDNSITLDAEGSTPTGDYAVIADAVRFLLTTGPTPTPTPTPTPSPTPTPTPTPSPTPSGKVYVNDIAMGSRQVGVNYYATATVWIKNDSGGDVEGAMVYGEWTGAVNEPDSGETGPDGKVTLESSKKKNGGTFNFCVTDVVATGYTYDPALNNETCDSITVP